MKHPFRLRFVTEDEGLKPVLQALANAVETLERNTSDRLDAIEHVLEEMKKQVTPEASEIAPGHKPWTQRRQERVLKHFKFNELMTKLKEGTNGV
jgi:hypothetical protein